MTRQPIESSCAAVNGSVTSRDIYRRRPAAAVLWSDAAASSAPLKKLIDAEVNDAVMQYATRHDIAIVIRYNGDKPDPNRREDVLREINKTVVFQNRIDITPDVLALLNRDGQPAAQVGGRPAGSSIPR